MRVVQSILEPMPFSCVAKAEQNIMRTDKNYYPFVLAVIVLAMIFVGIQWLFQQWWFIVLFVIAVVILIVGLALWIWSKFK